MALEDTLYAVIAVEADSSAEKTTGNKKKKQKQKPDHINCTTKDRSNLVQT